MVTISSIDPYRESEVVQQLVEAYASVFGEEPWNEGYRCPSCGEAFPLGSELVFCPLCAKKGWSIPVVKYWPTETILTDFYREVGKPSARCLVAKDGDKVVGFAWGYDLVVGEGIDGSLEAPGLAMTLPAGVYYYGDEVAVLKEYRNRGIGTQLTESLFAGKIKVLLRTLADSTMFRIIERLGGRAVLSISRNRVIMTLER
ncbi:MAG: GNAT family N-acetyltransferase [Candidatus Vogelbacteria bacterium]|nr:GNAT family N-acetyltransferase [Candidatus Vogelbacteria bacterium]